MEIIIVIAIIIASVAYVVNRITRTIRNKSCACDDCPGCALKEQMQKKGGNPCCDKQLSAKLTEWCAK